ncbi:hypothetical protein SAMN06295998_1228 [Primorskyibacter flagellatus]|uniref:Uncharacterized protein n=2 Tax=Primorskyibacter flagellatus TaxID=1387277 RepID=A0A1W2E4X3_9RHOB|nr:hypothetical protein SAMN06295998_1228 [Primorskyibacter flagellatus]
MYLFSDDLPGPLCATRIPYWEQSSMAGSFHPNPYHPPLDSVFVQTFWGMRRRKVIVEPVAEPLAHLPQYKSGLWSYIEGYRPC